MTALGGRFHDGRGGPVRPVTVQVTAQGLHIRGRDNLLVAFWRAADVAVDGTPAGGKGVRLRCRGDDRARLEVEYDAPLRSLLPPTPTRRRPGWAGMAGAAVALAGLAGMLWLGFTPLVRGLAPLVPPAWEQAWGDHLARQWEGRWRVCRQPAGDVALRLLADRLGGGLDPAWRPRRIMVVDQPQARAVTLPGGTVVLTSALIAQARDADALAAVLAVEFARLPLRQPVAAALTGGPSDDDDRAAAQAARAILARAGLGGGGALDAERWAALRAICG